MNTPSRTDVLCFFQTPAIRHLAWLCQAPQLLNSPLSFRPINYLPENYVRILKVWDQNPKLAPPLLLEPPQKRLGFYFERLYQVLLENLLGWDILLKNQQIHVDGRTIGELDFVIHNRVKDRIEHHEIAIKFYLGVPQNNQKTLWYGPNAIDRLDLKTGQLLHHQSQRTQHPDALALLEAAGISGTITPQIFMPGYLFYPNYQQVLTPDYVPSDHLQGTWIYTPEARQADTSKWVTLNKPHWIGPWVQSAPPNCYCINESLQFVEHHSVPQLFSVLAQDASKGIWKEIKRVFVVPETWP
jgi:hypothetical protein